MGYSCSVCVTSSHWASHKCMAALPTSLWMGSMKAEISNQKNEWIIVKIIYPPFFLFLFFLLLLHFHLSQFKISENQNEITIGRGENFSKKIHCDIAFLKTRKNNKFCYPGRRKVIWLTLVYCLYIYLNKTNAWDLSIKFWGNGYLCHFLKFLFMDF